MKILNYLKVIRNFLLTIWLVLGEIFYVLIYGSIVLGISFIVEKFKGRDKALEYVSREVSKCGRNAFRLTGCRVNVEGKENVPDKGPFVIVSNHQSLMDIPFMPGYVYGRISFIAKIEVSKMPGLSWFVKRLDGVFVDRGNRAQTAGAMRKLMRVLKNGGTMVLFPEGTRSTDGKMLEFKEGSLTIPYRMKIPILPVSISGTRNIIKKGGYLFSPSKVNAKIMKPIDPRDFENENELVKSVHSAVKEGLWTLESGSDKNVENKTKRIGS